jgi:hypothetical protein
MCSKILMLILILSFLWGYAQQMPFPPAREPLEPFFIYFPIITVSPPPTPPNVRVVETARITTFGSFWGMYPINHYLYGYVENLDSAPVYSATVGVDSCCWSYIDPTTCSIGPLQPAFPVTLPGQINPFAKMTFVHYKGGCAMRGTSLFDTGYIEPGPRVLYPVTIVDSSLEEGYVIGTVRNDNNATLYNVRVVAFADRCGWKEQTLAVTTLQSGEEVVFSGPYDCELEDLIIVGQGKTGP